MQAVPYQIVGPLGITTQVDVEGTDSCSGAPVILTSSSTFSSSNTPVATVGTNTGTVSLVAPGTATIHTHLQYLQGPEYINGHCIPNSLDQDTPTNVTPAISGPNTVWYFNGLSPSGYATSITLTSSGGASTTWTVTTGADKINLSSTTGSSISVTSSGSAFSSAVGDVKITATANGQTSDPFSITTRTPYRLVAGIIQTNCDTTYGYESQINYTIQDQLLTALPSDVGVNEQWATDVVTDYAGANWRRGAAGGTTASGGQFLDSIKGEDSLHSPTASCTAASTKVQHWGQDWRTGSSISGNGKRVQSNTLQKYLNHAAHEAIVSPAP